MQVTDKDYLDAQGFSVFLYDSTYHPVFVDQKNTAMEMILHGLALAYREFEVKGDYSGGPDDRWI